VSVDTINAPHEDRRPAWPLLLAKFSVLGPQPRHLVDVLLNAVLGRAAAGGAHGSHH